jgi:beta-glucanase (GH16 family)
MFALRTHAILANIVLAGLVLGPSDAVRSNNGGVAETCKLTPVMLEEFDELSISPNKIGPARWTAHTPWNGDFGDAQFIDPSPQGGPFEIRNGMLAITATRHANGRWTSGLIAAADASGAGTGTRYGYFETRMKMPPGPGTWPAFWLAALKPVAGSDGNVEVDVIEYYGQFTAAYQAVVHVWYKDVSKKRGEGKIITVPDKSLVEDFQIFGVDISPQSIVFLKNGEPVWSYPTPPELDGPLYPLVNLALGSGWPIDKTPNPSTLLVDYVRIYTREAGPPGGCPIGLPKPR